MVDEGQDLPFARGQLRWILTSTATPEVFEERAALLAVGVHAIVRAHILSGLKNRIPFRAVTQPRRNFSRSSAFDGVISRISALTTFSATNGSSLTLL